MKLSKFNESRNIFNKFLIIIIDIIFYSLRKLNSLRRNDSDNIVILSLHLLGDTVFTIPAIKIIKEKFPNKKIIIFCYEESKKIYELYFDNLNYITISKTLLSLSGKIVGKKGREIFYQSKPSILIDLTTSSLSASLLFSSSARIIIGTNIRCFKNLYDYYYSIKRDTHLINLYLHPVIKYFSLDDNKIIFNPLVDNSVSDLILIHPFAGWKAKEWPLKNYIELADRLSKKYNVKLIFQKGQVQKDILDEINTLKIKYTETENFGQLIDEIKNCKVLIGNDSGPVHIACLLGKSTFSIYGPTNPEYSFLPVAGSEYVFAEIICSPGKTQYCYRFGGIFCDSFECVNFLSVEVVWQKLESFLKKFDNSRRDID